jgi:four helix bundle protein
MKSHNDLKVYQVSMDLVVEVYKLTADFPDSEKFGLTSQIRRCSVSIPSNIAEGAARESKKEFKRFLFISLGSATELETQIEISYRLAYIGEYEDLKHKIFHIKRMLIKLIQTLKT